MKVIETLRIKNFQTHKDTTLHFCKGLNVLVGESRNGKTAILRILRWIYYNEPRGDRFIRTGEEQCEGEVILADGTSVQRIRNRNGKINCYVLNEPGQEEQVFTKFGWEVPLEIQQALGVSKLYLDKDSSIELNFSRQMDAAFLVNDSGPRKSKIIGRVVNLHVIDSARRTAENDLKTANRKKTDLEKEVCSLQEQVSVFDDLPDKEAALKQAYKLLAQSNDLKNKADKLQEIQEAIQQIQLHLEIENEKLARLQNIETASKLTLIMCSKEKTLSCMEETHECITVSLQCLDIHTKLLNKLSSLDTVEKYFGDILTQTVRLTNLQSIYQQITSTKNSLQDQEGILAQLYLLNEAANSFSLVRSKLDFLNTFTEIHTHIKEGEAKLLLNEELLHRTQEVEQGQKIISALYQLREKGFKLSEIQSQIKDSQEQLQRHMAVGNRLANIEKVFEFLTRLRANATRLNTLEDLETRCKTLGSQYNETVRNMASLEVKYLHIMEEYKDTLKKSGSCPICHTIMTPETVNKLANVV